jgi:hypothetical protein
MSISHQHWRCLKKVFLESSEINKLVISWVDDAEPTKFVTKWEQRFFLQRLVCRAYRELNFAKGKSQIEDIVLAGNMVESRKGRKYRSFILPSQWLLFPYVWMSAEKLPYSLRGRHES